MTHFRVGTSVGGGLGVLLAGFLFGCSESQAPQAWSALATCLAGDKAQAELPARIQHLRLVQLGNTHAPGAKDAWPERCAEHANKLYASLDTSGKPDMLRRKLQERLGCADDKASCKLANDEKLIPTATELWETAKNAELAPTPAAGVPKPNASPEPAVTQASWKSFTAKPQRLEGPWLAPQGHALLLTKDAEGRGKPTGCKLPAGFAKITCAAPHASVPELPLQSVRLVQDAAGLYAAGLTESGLTAYNLETGETAAVRGGAGGLVVNGVAVEGEAGSDGGFSAVRVKNGKASKDAKLPAKMPLNKPMSLHEHAIWLEGLEDGVAFVAKSMKGDRLSEAANIKGSFKGPFHTCEAEGMVGVATWERRAGQPSAKPTAGADKTQLTVTLFRDGAWSKPLEATLPFERLVESELVCTKNGVSVAYAQRAGGVLEVGRVDCGADGCKTATSKLPGVESKWWWLLTPLGDRVLMMWRSDLGETRLRVAPLGELPAAPDKLVFDTADYGGPTVNDAMALVSSEAALLVFRNERPVAVRLGNDGAISVVAP